MLKAWLLQKRQQHAPFSPRGTIQKHTGGQQSWMEPTASPAPSLIPVTGFLGPFFSISHNENPLLRTEEAASK